MILLVSTVQLNLESCFDPERMQCRKDLLDHCLLGAITAKRQTERSAMINISAAAMIPHNSSISASVGDMKLPTASRTTQQPRQQCRPSPGSARRGHVM